MIVIVAVAIIVTAVIAFGVSGFIDRRNAAQREDIDVDSLLGNLARLDALRATGLMDAPVRADLDELTREAAAAFHAPMAFMTLVDDKRQFFASAFGWSAADARGTGLEQSYCKHVVAGQAALVVTDATADDRVRHNGGTLLGGVRSYLGVPLRTDSGQVIGSFCVVDTNPRVWSPEALGQLEVMARRAMEVALHPAGS